MSLLNSNSLPAERFVGCFFAENFYSSYDVLLNGGTVLGSPIFNSGVYLNSTSYFTYDASENRTFSHNSSGFSFLCYVNFDTLYTDYPEDNGLFDMPIQSSETASDSDIGFWVNYNAVSGYFTVKGQSTLTDSVQSVSGATSIVTGDWHSIGCALDFANDTISIYLDGSQEVSSSVTFGSNSYVVNSNPNPMYIGHCVSGSNNYRTSCYLRNVRLFRRVLSVNDFSMYHQSNLRGNL